MQKAMTLKEIAGLCGFRSTKTLLSWVKKDGQNMTVIGEKLTEAQKTKKPAQFTLDETIEIIRAGGNETLATLLYENAKELKTNEKHLTMADLPVIMAEFTKAVLPVILKTVTQKEPLALPSKEPDGYTVKGYANLKGLRYSARDLQRLGKKCAALSREKGYFIGKVADETWGELGVYHIDILKDVFEIPLF